MLEESGAQVIVRYFLIVFGFFALSCSHPNDYLYRLPQVSQKKVNSGPPGALHGTVTNAIDGEPLGGVSVVLHDGSAHGPIVFTTSTTGDGSYDIQRLAAQDYFVDFTYPRYVSIMAAPVTVNSGHTTLLNESMTTVLGEGQYRIILNWTSQTDGAVRDVDSYLIIPDHETQPIYYFNKVGLGANLDHDNTSWMGPETITITDLQLQGTYIYYINNYNIRCDRQALAHSAVTVRVIRGSTQIRTYTIPENEEGTTYEFFRIVNGEIVDTKHWNDDLKVYGDERSCVQ